jgi:DNA polymerase III subunit delta'
MPLREVLGHTPLINLLKRSVANGTLPPSLLFAGPSGVGKRKAAVALAQLLNCLAPRDGDACGECAACTRIARRVHPDIVFIEPADTGLIRIETVRDAIDRAGYRPFEGRRRIVIIDEAGALTAHAQSALLKTLEEPPPSSVFVLVTAHPDMILPTVRSRCPMLRFGQLSTSDVAAVLVANGRSAHEAQTIAAIADGSLSHALGASASELAEARDVAQRVLIAAANERSSGRRIEAAKDLLENTGAGGAGDREQLSSHLRAMASLVRDAEAVALRVDERVLVNRDLRPLLDRLATTYRGDRAVRAYTAIDRALIALERNAGVKIVADWLALQL